MKRMSKGSSAGSVSLLINHVEGRAAILAFSDEGAIDISSFVHRPDSTCAIDPARIKSCIGNAFRGIFTPIPTVTSLNILNFDRGHPYSGDAAVFVICQKHPTGFISDIYVQPCSLTEDRLTDTLLGVSSAGALVVNGIKGLVDNYNSEKIHCESACGILARAGPSGQHFLLRMMINLLSGLSAW